MIWELEVHFQGIPALANETRRDCPEGGPDSEQRAHMNVKVITTNPMSVALALVTLNEETRTETNSECQLHVSGATMLYLYGGI